MYCYTTQWYYHQTFNISSTLVGNKIVDHSDVAGASPAGTKPLSQQCWDIVNLTIRNKLQWNFNRNSYIFIQENAFENVVCKMASIISSRTKWVKTASLYWNSLQIPLLKSDSHLPPSVQSCIIEIGWTVFVTPNSIIQYVLYTNNT